MNDVLQFVNILYLNANYCSEIGSKCRQAKLDATRKFEESIITSAIWASSSDMPTL